MVIEVLGPLRVDGQSSLSPRERTVLAALVVRRGRAVAADELADAVWGDTPPASWPKQVQICIWGVRKRLGAPVIETVNGGYCLPTGTDLDAVRFEELIAAGRHHVEARDPDRAVATFAHALGMWRGRPFDDLERWAPGRLEAARLEEMNLSAQEEWLDARLALGEHFAVAAEAEVQAAEQPLRERRWGTLAVAQYRCGRQADALRSLRRARSGLVEQLGVEPGASLVHLERLILDHDDALLVADQAKVSATCPYPGLAPYDVSDADAFFGRTAEVVTCLDRLIGLRLLVISGASGSGKSSLVRAGIVPRLRDRRTDVAIMVPGRDPDGAMTSALATNSGHVLLVVDQFEEVFAPGHDPIRARAFCERLAAYATSCAPVIITIRSDQLGQLADAPVLARLVEAGLFLVGPLDSTALRDVIECPAACAGLRVEAGLTDLLVREVAGEPGALPLLSHALAETWERREGRVLTIGGYRATGEIHGAVARSAEQLYQGLTPEQQAWLRSLLLRLVAVSTDGAPIRTDLVRRVLHSEHGDRTLDLLVRARLVVADDATVGLAHEALIHAWPRFRSWLDEDADGQRILRHLAAAAGTWDTMGRPDSELYRGARLEAASEWSAAPTMELSALESSFLDRSRDLAVAERRAETARVRRQVRQNRRLRAAVLAIASLLVAAVATGVVALRQRDEARAQEREAALSALIGDAASLRSNRRDLAALLAVEAHRLAPGAASESALLGIFTAAPGADGTSFTGVPTSVQDVRADAAYLPDGTLAIADVHGAIHLLGPDGEPIAVLDALSDQTGISSMTVSNDGRAAVVAWHVGDRAPSVMTVWDLENRERRFYPVEIARPVGSVAINGDGTIVAAVVDNGTVHVVDAEVGRPLLEIEPVDADATAPITPVAFAADDDLLAIGSSSGPIRIVSTVTGDEVDRLDGPPSVADHFVGFDTLGSSLVTAGSKGAQRYDLSSGDALWSSAVGLECKDVTLADRVGLLLCGEDSGRVVALDLATGASLGRRYDPEQGDVCGLALSEDQRRLAIVTACRTGAATIVRWRLDGAGPISTNVPGAGDHWVEHFGFGGSDALVAAWQEPDDPYPVTRAIEFAAPGETSILAELPGVYLVWSTDDPAIVVAFYPAQTTADETIGLYDVGRKEPAGPKIHPGVLMGSALWTDGRTATMIVDDYHRVITVDLESGATAQPTFDVSPGTIGQVHIDGDRMYTQAEDWTGEGQGFRVERRDRMTGALIATSDSGYIKSAVGGGHVIAVTLDGRIVELDPDTLAPVADAFPSVHGGVGVGVLSLDTSGRRLIVRADDDSLRVYDVATRTQLGDPIDVASDIQYPSAAVRGDGLAVAADTQTGIVVWDLDPAQWEAAACRLAGRNLTRAEWNQYLRDLAPYRLTCPEHPA